MDWRWSSVSDLVFTKVKQYFSPLSTIVYALGLCLPLYFFYSGYQKMHFYQEIAKEISSAEKALDLRQQEVKKQRALCQLPEEQDSQFLDNIVSQLTFLNPQKAHFKELVDTLDVVGQEFVRDNLQAMQDNNLVFSEDLENEMLVHLAQPVFMNMSDVQQLIALIEGVRVGLHAPHPLRPDLSFAKISLKRVYNSPGIMSVNFTIRKG